MYKLKIKASANLGQHIIVAPPNGGAINDCHVGSIQQDRPGISALTDNQEKAKQEGASKWHGRMEHGGSMAEAQAAQSDVKTLHTTEIQSIENSIRDVSFGSPRNFGLNTKYCGILRGIVHATSLRCHGSALCRRRVSIRSRFPESEIVSVTCIRLTRAFVLPLFPSASSPTWPLIQTRIRGSKRSVLCLPYFPHQNVTSKWLRGCRRHIRLFLDLLVQQ